MISLYPLINDFFEICLIVANGSIKIATHNLESPCLCQLLLLLCAVFCHFRSLYLSAFSHFSVAKKVHFIHSIRAGFTLLFVRHSFSPHSVVCFVWYCDFSNRMLMFSFFEARVLPCLVKFRGTKERRRSGQEEALTVASPPTAVSSRNDDYARHIPVPFKARNLASAWPFPSIL